MAHDKAHRRHQSGTRKFLVVKVQFQCATQVSQRLIQRSPLCDHGDLQALGDVPPLTLGDHDVNRRLPDVVVLTARRG